MGSFDFKDIKDKITDAIDKLRRPSVPTPPPVVVYPGDKVKAGFLLDNLKDTTLDLFSDKRSDSSFKLAVERQAKMGFTHIYAYVYNMRDGKAYGWFYPTNPFASAKAEQLIHDRLDYLNKAGFKVICVSFGDDGGYPADHSVDYSTAYDLGKEFGYAAHAFLASIESDEFMSASEETSIVEGLQASGKPTYVHYRPFTTSNLDAYIKRFLSSGADDLHYQLGFGHSVDYYKAMVQKVEALLAAGGSLNSPVVMEYSRNSTEGIGKQLNSKGGYGNG